MKKVKKLKLNLKRKWFDMIKLRVKREEYREIKPYFISMFFDWKRSGRSREDFCKYFLSGGTLCHNLNPWLYLKDFDVIEFLNGMTPPVPRFDIELEEIEIRPGREEWGAEYCKLYFVLRLGEVVE